MGYISGFRVSNLLTWPRKSSCYLELKTIVESPRREMATENLRGSGHSYVESAGNLLSQNEKTNYDNG